jgi:hypothetical protein
MELPLFAWLAVAAAVALPNLLFVVIKRSSSGRARTERAHVP